MAIVIPNVGETYQLDELIAALLDGALFHLFATSTTLDEDTTLADFTECSFTGYAAVALTGWSAATIELDGKAHSSPSNVSITPGSGGSGNVYGWYVTDAGDTEVLFCDSYSGAPLTIASGVALITEIDYALSQE